MAAPLRRDPEFEALLREGAAELKRLNPHIGAPSQDYSEEEYAILLRDEEELASLWASPEGQRAQALGYSAADAIDEDRGE